MNVFLYLVAIPGFFIGAIAGRHLWRIGLRAPVIITALGFAALAAMVAMVGLALNGPDPAQPHLQWALALMAGPVLGLVLGMVLGVWRGPAALNRGRP